MWTCKSCSLELSSRYVLLKHFRQAHGHIRGVSRFPCPYSDCPCSFTTWTKLLNHTYKNHSEQTTQNKSEQSIFQCPICSRREYISERNFFQHINTHLRRHQTVQCLFKNCEFETNIYSTFQTHKYRKHNKYSLHDFRDNICIRNQLIQSGSSEDDLFKAGTTDTLQEKVDYYFEERIACLLLKLENVIHVPTTVVDELLSELDYLLSTASLHATKTVISGVFQNNQLQIEESLIDEISSIVCRSSPVCVAIASDSPLATAYKRKQYYCSHFGIIEPIEYILDAQRNRTYQYIPLLRSLQQLLSQKDVLELLVAQKGQNTQLTSQEYRTVRDGEYYKQNSFFCGEELRIAVNLYIDDFEICNPLGTSRKKHKLCGVYWVLGNLPPGSHSALTSIYLAVLCKSDDTKAFGFVKVLEPLIQDLTILEKHGVFVSQLGKFLKGSVQCVIADNLSAHGIGGFVESFAGGSICRFCTGDKSEFQNQDVMSGIFQLRTREVHEIHVRCAQEKATAVCGVKKQCVLTENLSHFHVSTGYPPDIVHDIFEGIVPTELARCISLLIAKKYFTLDKLNTLIQKFPYKFGDKTNRPHAIPHTYSSKNTIGGNAHENWSLLRLLPLIIGPLLPVDEPAWQVILHHKDIVELVVAHVHTDETIAYLEAKIYDHRQLYLDLFPHVNLLPKHHYLEHYPQMIKCFGPLISLWTMRFEAKHSFFKQVARHTNCFKNIPFSLAVKHQFMIAHQTHSSNYKKSSLEVRNASVMPVEVLNDRVVSALMERYPSISEVALLKKVSCNGMHYSQGMLIVHGTVNGLPKFNEIIQLCIVEKKLCFIVRELCSWYREHYGGFELSTPSTRELAIIELGDLEDPYPLADYIVEGLRLVMLKRFIIVKGKFSSIT
ncbi:all-trans-retinol 3,4-desaturase [Sarotherodon galilaeus]